MQKMDRTRDRIYTLLALIYPWRDIAAAEWTMLHGESRARASASEYLDNILTGQLRKRIMPIIEDLPHDEKVRRGNVLLKTRPRDLEETLLQLINDDDQVVAATAIELVRELKLWDARRRRRARAGVPRSARLVCVRVRFVGAGRAAHAGLAAARAVARAAARLRDRRPASERCRSSLATSVDELFRIANASKQVRHEAGTVLLQEGVVPATIHVLLDGRVAASRADEAPTTMDAPAAFGFVEALQGAQIRRTIRTLDVAVTLAMSADELRTLLADNTALVRGLFTTLADRVSPDGRQQPPAHGRGARTRAACRRRAAAGREDPGAPARTGVRAHLASTKCARSPTIDAHAADGGGRNAVS